MAEEPTSSPPRTKRLFFATIPVVEYVHIAVAAPDEAAALEYLSSTEEWKEDGGFQFVDTKHFLPPKLTEIADPAQVLQFNEDMDGTELCWGRDCDDTTMGEAFFDRELVAIEPRSELLDDDDANDAEWDKFFAVLQQRRQDFVRMLAEAKKATPAARTDR